MSDTKRTKRIYVLSWAPSYGETSSGGFEWAEEWAEILDMTSRGEHCVLSEGADYRVTTLDLPEGLTQEEITDLLDGYLHEIIEVPSAADKMGELHLTELRRLVRV